MRPFVSRRNTLLRDSSNFRTVPLVGLLCPVQRSEARRGRQLSHLRCCQTNTDDIPFLFPNVVRQLEKIIEATGKPSPEDIQSIRSPFAGTMLESIPPTRQISLSEVFSGASAQALDLMFQCLQFNPDKRVRAADALKHPYVAEFHNPDDEPDYPHGAIQVCVPLRSMLRRYRCPKCCDTVNC